MRLGIDATNLQGGGGLHSLLDVLRHSRPQEFGFSAVTVWADDRQAELMPKRPWLSVVSPPGLGGNSARRFITQAFSTRHHFGYDVIFSPGGIQRVGKTPVVSMAHTMLPFDREARRACPGVIAKARLELLRVFQGRTLRSAHGIIFLTHYAMETIRTEVGTFQGQTIVVPHGVSPEFREASRNREWFVGGTRPFRWLYVSPITFYKRHLELLDAARIIRSKNGKFELRLVGGYDSSAVEIVRKVRRECADAADIEWFGDIPHSEIVKQYRWADALVFPSGCENLPLTLLEAMACGLPIVCTNR